MFILGLCSYWSGAAIRLDQLILFLTQSAVLIQLRRPFQLVILFTVDFKTQHERKPLSFLHMLLHVISIFLICLCLSSPKNSFFYCVN